MTMRVGLFVPCYMDVFHPRAGMAAVTVLEKLGVDVEFPEAQTCCGQPLLNSGMAAECPPVARRFVDVFRHYDAIVCPSGSCTAMVRHRYPGLVEGRETERVAGNTWEFCEFLVDVLGVDAIDASFPHRVGVHRACHGLRELRLGPASEVPEPRADKVETLLGKVSGLEIVDLERPDECCGFGGTFSVNEDAVSSRMGADRIADHRAAGAEVIVSTDTSCLMHLEGLMKREGRALPVLHVAQVLAGEEPADG